MVFRVIAVLFAVLLATTASAQTDYRLKPGDVLRIEVLEDPTLNRDALVLPDGSISFPLAGAISAGGRTTTQIAGALADSIGPNFAARPTVSVSVSSLGQQVAATGGGGGRATIDVYLMGEVNGPGKVSVDRGTTILQALAQAGGFTQFAAVKRIQLRRTDARSGAQSVYTINYRDIENGVSNVGNTVLTAGDVIIVPERRLFE